MKANDSEMVDLFVEDLLERGHKTIDAEYNVEKTKSIGSLYLHSSNLIFFGQLIREIGLVNSQSEKEIYRNLFNLMLTQGFGFVEDEDILDS